MPPWYDSWSNYLHKRGFYLRFEAPFYSFSQIQAILWQETITQNKEQKCESKKYDEYKTINHLPFIPIQSALLQLDSYPKWKIPPNFDSSLESIYVKPYWLLKARSKSVAVTKIPPQQVSLPKIIQSTQITRPHLWSIIHNRIGLIFTDPIAKLDFYDFFTFNTKTKSIKLNSWSFTLHLRYLILRQKILPTPLYYELMSELEPKITSLTVTSLSELPLSPNLFSQIIIAPSLCTLFNEQTRVIFS